MSALPTVTQHALGHAGCRRGALDRGGRVHLRKAVADLAACPLPLQLLWRFEHFLASDALATNLYRLDAEDPLAAAPAAHTGQARRDALLGHADAQARIARPEPAHER